MLHTTYRPNNFEEVKGQEFYVKLLSNQVSSGKVGNYLLVGPSGCGKTTLGRITAKSANCESLTETGNSCGKCNSCLEQTLNVIEIDAPSNNTVEDMNRLIESMKYRPEIGKYKVYIIDEVHALSGAAFQKLLKVLEEPPAWVRFILCTTELHKINIAIKNRCMTLMFNRIPHNQIVDRMEYICNDLGVNYTKEGLMLIANYSNGLMREALSGLQMCIDFGDVNVENVSNILGVVNSYAVLDMVKKILAKDISGALECVTTMHNQGKDLEQLILDMQSCFRNLMLVQSIKDQSLFNIDINYIKDIVVSDKECNSAITMLSDFKKSITSDNQKVILDIVTVQLASLFTNVSIKETNNLLDTAMETKNKTTKELNSAKVEEKSKVVEEKCEVKSKDTNTKEINYNKYIPLKVYLLNSFKNNDEILYALFNSYMYVKSNGFYIQSKTKEVSDLLNKNKEIIIKTAREIAKVNLNIIIK